MFLLIVTIIIIIITVNIVREERYKKLEAEVLGELNISGWAIISSIDEYVTVKGRQTLEKYDDIKFFKENREKFVEAENII